MFDGSEQFHQFIASSRASLPISLPFPLHGNPSFDPYPPQPPLPQAKKFPLISTDLALESERASDPWSNDELLALLKVRSSMEIWFPDFTWEHVSRKLGELGFKRTGEECKDKLEEESRQFNSTKNYRILSELDEFYHGGHHQVQQEEEEEEAQISQEKVEMSKKLGQDAMIPISAQVEEEEEAKKWKCSSKRKRRDKFEKFKGLCSSVVSKMMAQQEELHKKLIEDMIRRDQEKMAREEAWRNQEMERFRSEMEIRSKDHKSAAERQATIIHFLKHLTSHDHQPIITDNNSNSNSNSNSSASIFCKTVDVAAAAPIHQKTPSPSSPSSDVGKRWPRDEVLALINLRCKTGGAEQDASKEGSNSNSNCNSSKGPLWERISQGMTEMGYKRSAKRCKEKWENINKYFRKTKDSTKKRSPNSRTCPYFHHLTSLYSDGTIVAPNATAEINQSRQIN